MFHSKYLLGNNFINLETLLGKNLTELSTSPFNRKIYINLETSPAIRQQSHISNLKILFLSWKYCNQVHNDVFKLKIMSLSSQWYFEVHNLIVIFHCWKLCWNYVGNYVSKLCFQHNHYWTWWWWIWKHDFIWRYQF